MDPVVVIVAVVGVGFVFLPTILSNTQLDSPFYYGLAALTAMLIVYLSGGG